MISRKCRRRRKPNVISDDAGMRSDRSVKLILFAASMLLAVIPGVICSNAYPQDQSHAEGTQIISSITITMDHPYDARRRFIDIAKQLIPLQEEGVFSAQSLNDAIETLKQSGIFEKIHADIEEEGRLVHVMIQLTPFRRIKDIRITNAFPLFGKEILNRMTIHRGAVYRREKLDEQKTHIVDYMRREGYISPGAKLSSAADPQDGHIIIQVDIEKGNYFVLDEIAFSGNRYVSGFRLRSLMDITPSRLRLGIAKRFKEAALIKDVKYLTAYYRKRGYADCRIQHRTETLRDNRIRVLVDIHEGHRYAVRFSGNRHIPNRILKRDLVLFSTGNANDIGLKRAISKIRERYRAAGFLKAEINMTSAIRTSGQETWRDVEFSIDEGHRSKVEAVHIQGNELVSDASIRDQLLSAKSGFFKRRHYVPEILRDDLAAVKALYLRNGFMNAEVKDLVTPGKDPASVSIRIAVEEKGQTIVSALEIAGLASIPKQTAYDALGLKIGSPFRRYMVESGENRLSSLVSEMGHPFVTVKGSAAIDESGKTAQVRYDVDEGPYVTTGQTVFTGNFRTKEGTLSNAFGVAPESAFSLARILEGQKSLRDMDIFESVQLNPVGLREEKDKIHLMLELAEKKPYYFELETGYATHTGAFLHSKAGDTNLWGLYKGIWLGADLSETGYQLQVGVKSPQFFDPRIAMEAGLYTERREELNQDFGTTVTGASIGFMRRRYHRLNAALNARFEQRRQFPRLASADPSGPKPYEEFERRTVFVVSPGVTYDTRDSFIRPRRGFYADATVDISKGVDSDIDDFMRMHLGGRFLASPLEGITFAWIGRIGHLIAFGSEDDVPEDQLFFLGGAATVRGFEENMLQSDIAGKPLGGRTAISGSMEARLDLGRNIELTLFYDTGQISGVLNVDSLAEFRDGAGIGLRYITPIGPIGFLYGQNLLPRAGEASGKLYFSIGYSF